VLSVFNELSTISFALSEAMKAQAQILQSSVALQALQSAKVFESFKRMAGTLQSMASFNNACMQFLVESFLVRRKLFSLNAPFASSMHACIDFAENL
jgi:hypothetical protein